MAAEGIEQQWMRERDEKERQAREELQRLAASLVGDYKVSLVSRVGDTRWVGGGCEVVLCILTAKQQARRSWLRSSLIG